MIGWPVSPMEILQWKNHGVSKRDKFLHMISLLPYILVIERKMTHIPLACHKRWLKGAGVGTETERAKQGISLEGSVPGAISLRQGKASWYKRKNAATEGAVQGFFLENSDVCS